VLHTLSLHDALPIFGMARNRIAAMLAAEAGLMTAVGCLVGFALGAAIAMILVYQVNPVSFHWRMDITWPFGLLATGALVVVGIRSEEHTSELQSREK